MRLINQCLPLRRLPALYYPTPRIMAQKRKANGATHVQVYSTRRSSQRIAKQDTVTVYTEEDTIALEPKRVKQAKQTPKHKPAKSTKPITIKAGPRNEEDYDATHQVDEDVAVLPPRFDSDQLPLPWKGRLGYVRLSLPHCTIQLIIRPVSTHICEQQTRQSSHQEHVASPQS